MPAPMTFDLETEVRDLFAAKMREFAAFCAENWLTSASECEALTKPSRAPAEYARGYNEAMTDGISGALDHWLDEELGYGR
jgi:hypothetical protein